jgi:hypothetical protein
MKLHGNCAVQLAIGLCGFAALGWFGAANAQAIASAQSTVPAASQPPFWHVADAAAAPVYQDQYFGGESQAPDIAKGGDDTSDDAGLARSLQIDGVVSALSSHNSSSSSNVVENGIVAKTQWDTATYGAWSLDASARTGASGDAQSEQGQGGVVTLRQRGMPFDGGWQADNALGDLNAPDVGLAKLQPRFYFPTGPMQGLTTDWHGPSGLQVVGGGGVPGLFDGILVPNFHTLDGSTATAGAQWSPASQWTVGGQFIEAHDVNLAVGQVVDGNSLLSSDTGLLSAAWRDQNEHLQVNLLDGEVSGKGNGIGGWVDGSMTQGRVQQTAGLFRIDPNLTWGNQLIANDMQGGYYRLDYQSRRWLADVGIDEVRSVSGLTSDTTFLTGDTRYQVSRDCGIGGIADVSRTNGGTNWSTEGYVDHANLWGTGRAQADFARTGSGRDSTLTLDQTWSAPAGLRLSTSTSIERVNGVIYDGYSQDSTLLGISAYGGGQFTTRLGVEGNVRWLTAVQGRAPPGTSANVSLTYQLAPNWEVLATYYDSRAGSWTQLTVVSPLTPPVPTTIPGVQERGIFLTLRYKRASGLHFAPLGGGPGGASGEIVGTVYLDANNNGRADAGEGGAPNVTVVLDGRFSVQTDASGRFYFPAVATGHHVITVISDNLPLPWILVGDGRAEVDVTTRDRTVVSIAAQRPY